MDLTELETKWKKVMFTHTASLVLWREYFGFLTSELSKFKMATVLNQYYKCIETLVSMTTGVFTSHTLDPARAQAALVDIVTESCYFIRAAGFGEKVCTMPSCDDVM